MNGTCKLLPCSSFWFGEVHKEKTKCADSIGEDAEACETLAGACFRSCWDSIIAARNLIWRNLPEKLTRKLNIKQMKIYSLERFPH